MADSTMQAVELFQNVLNDDDYLLSAVERQVGVRDRIHQTTERPDRVAVRSVAGQCLDQIAPDSELISVLIDLTGKLDLLISLGRPECSKH